ncbi:MAG: Lacal_2735 family protein [Flavobacteriales bacterium]|nr:Lacal_2735 family protein [Flavobacteriales bacterium]
MMKLFKKKSPVEKLNQKYAKLMKEAHQLSSVDRRKSDAKVSEAEAVLNQIKELEG